MNGLLTCCIWPEPHVHCNLLCCSHVSPLDVLWGTGIDLWGKTWPITAPHPANLVSRDPTGLGSPEMIWRFLNERPQNSRFLIVSEHGHIELHSKFPRMLPIILHVIVLFLIKDDLIRTYFFYCANIQLDGAQVLKILIPSSTR